MQRPMQPVLSSTLSTDWTADGITIETLRGRFHPYDWS